MKVFEDELKRRIEEALSRNDIKTAEAIRIQLQRFKKRHRLTRFKKSVQEYYLKAQVSHELLWCILQGQKGCQVYLKDLRDTHKVDNEVVELLRRINPQHHI